MIPCSTFLVFGIRGFMKIKELFKSYAFICGDEKTAALTLNVETGRFNQYIRGCRKCNLDRLNIVLKEVTGKDFIEHLDALGIEWLIKHDVKLNSKWLKEGGIIPDELLQLIVENIPYEYEKDNDDTEYFPNNVHKLITRFAFDYPLHQELRNAGLLLEYRKDLSTVSLNIINFILNKYSMFGLLETYNMLTGEQLYTVTNKKRIDELVGICCKELIE